MINVSQLNQNKGRILSFLRIRGPSLPIHVAREIKVEPLFVNAFLSELKGERKVKISNMKVGSSPLYYLEGQEEMLGNFSEHLNSREREAFDLLRSEKVLPDSAQEPVVRVALRALKDFAVPVKVRVGGESRLFWKYFSVDDSEIGEFVGKGMSMGRSEGEVNKSEISTGGLSDEGSMAVAPDSKVHTHPPTAAVDVGSVREKPKKVKEESEFVKSVKDYLEGKDIEILEVLAEKKKEFEARVRVDSVFGKQEYLLIAKDKKNVSESDLAVAVQKAQAARVLGLLMAPGELSKKGREHLSDWGNLVRWERLKF